MPGTSFHASEIFSPGGTELVVERALLAEVISGS